MRHATRLLVLLLLAAVAQPMLAEDKPLAFEFDGVNVSLDGLLDRAKAEKKLIFLDFYLPG